VSTISSKFLLQINNDGVKAIPFKRVPIVKKIKYFNESFVDKEFFVKLKNKKLFMVIEGEELYIHNITIPRVKNFRIYDMIKNELIYKFNNISNIIFNYNIIREAEEVIDVIVYCVNIENFNVLKKENYNGSNFIKVNLIQNYFISYFETLIKEEDYFFAFRYKRNVYFLLVSKKNIVANKVIAIDKNLLSYSEEFVAFLKNYREEYNYINKIYTVDITLSNTQLENFIVMKIKDLNIKDFLNHIILKG
jgi:hypothetical protein